MNCQAGPHLEANKRLPRFLPPPVFTPDFRLLTHCIQTTYSGLDKSVNPCYHPEVKISQHPAIGSPSSSDFCFLTSAFRPPLPFSTTYELPRACLAFFAPSHLLCFHANTNRASDKDASPERAERAEGSLLPLSTVLAHFALSYPLYFHSDTNCPFCNSFVLITIRIARGVAGGLTKIIRRISRSVLGDPPWRPERSPLS